MTYNDWFLYPCYISRGISYLDAWSVMGYIYVYSRVAK